MLLRNREIKLQLLYYVLLSALLTAVGAAFGAAVPVLAACAAMGIFHFVITALRYRKLRKLSADLEDLLLSGTLLPIREYSEGELSILGNQIQKLALRLTETAEKLRKDQIAQADSLADISHQLRTPITAMNLTAAMLSEPELSQQRRTELTMELKNLLHRTQWLVEALLKLSKLDAGMVQMRSDPVTLDTLLKKSAAPLTIPMELREQRLVMKCSGTVRADLTWTAEAIGNILKNAMEHTPTGGCITVTASETALYSQIIVEDNGPGFAREDLGRLFERFYKGKNGSESGYGIGLALARTIITAQNGTVHAANTPSGARFTVKFYK